MERIEKSVEVKCPVHAVYNQWTQFEEFPRFMAGVKEVKQIDDTHVRWHAEIWGKDKEWDAVITEQVPDQVIAWRSTSGDAPNAGSVRFESIAPERTRVRLTMEYEPQGAVENIGKRGQFFLVISPELFGEHDRFLDQVESMVEQVKAGEPLPGVEEVYLPGEIEQRHYEAAVQRGSISYPPSVVAALQQLGDQLGEPFLPLPSAGGAPGVR